MDGNTILLMIAEVILRATVRNLARPNKQRDWTPHTAFLLPPFLTEEEILDRETTKEELLKIFARSITEISEEGEYGDGDKDDKDSKEDKEVEEETKKKTGKKKKSTTEMLATTAEDCNNVLDFLQAVVVKSLRVVAVPLSLQKDKPACVWFCQWY